MKIRQVLSSWIFWAVAILMVPITLLAYWLIPVSWCYSSSKTYVQISREFKESKEYADLKNLECRMQTREFDEWKRWYFEGTMGKYTANAWRNFCLDNAKSAWDTAKICGGAWEIPACIVRAEMYLEAGDLDKASLGMTDEAIGKELFEYYIISFQVMLDSYRGKYLIRPPISYARMQHFLDAGGLTLKQMSVNPGEWAGIKIRF